MPLFWIFSRQSFLNLSVYRLNFWSEMFALFVQIFVATTLWNVLYAQAPHIFGSITLRDMVTYAVIGMILDKILSTDTGPHHYLSEQIKSGMVTNDLLRPIDFPHHMILRFSGETMARTAFYVVPPAIVAYLLFDLTGPKSVAQFGWFLLSLVFSWLILFFCNFLFGFISFKTLDLTGFFFTYWAMLRFLSGMLIPIWLYPDWMQSFINWLPFQLIFYTPLSIYINRFSGDAIWHAVLQQAVWVVVLYAIVRLLWRRIHRQLVVQGG
ncbi:ABC transporter permease [Effusibacillus dendaii]|uniref:ABC transporter permease n=1 Tax=Effusibacillus dendaii TaxID=2743772 RepID=A0A7I8D4Q9_9BACL|nr:ABC-2 family transporter protein [Effusibacillus dendaii]BCJ85103.1 ABC transporter permease [Effusibacillus dendaii]